MSPTRPAATSRCGSTRICRVGVEGDRVRGRHVLDGRRSRLLRAVVGGRISSGPADAADADRRIATTVEFWRRWLDGARIPDHRYRDPIQRSALAVKGLTYMPTGATVAALDDRPARDAGRRAQLGLPVQLDPRLDVHAAGAALAEPRLGSRRVHAVHRRPRAERRRRVADHVRDRRPSRPDGVDARPHERVRRVPAPCGSATAPTTSDRTTCSGRPSTRSSSTPAAASVCRAACGRSSRRRRSAPRRCGREPDQGIWEARGKPQHYVSSKLMCWVALDRAAKLAADARRPPSSRETWQATAEEIQADVLERGVTKRRRAAPALRHRRPRCVDPPRPDLRVPARSRTSGRTPASWRSPRT